MKFDYFIARSRFRRKEWLAAVEIYKFSQLVAYCGQHDLVPPDVCPEELFDDRTDHNKPTLVTKGVVQPPNQQQHVPESKKTQDEPVSQSLADHGVYVDSTEAMKVKSQRPRRPRKKVIRRGKNAKKD